MEGWGCGALAPCLAHQTFLPSPALRHSGPSQPNCRTPGALTLQHVMLFSNPQHVHCPTYNATQHMSYLKTQSFPF